MEKPLMRTPAVIADFAAIILEQTQGTEELQRFLPFRIEDQSDMWFVYGNVAHEYKGDLSRDGVQNERFALQVIKSDCEVTSVGIYADFNLSAEQKDSIRSVLQSEGKWPPISTPLFDRNRRDVHLAAVFYGGIVNSADAACRFGELVLRDALRASFKQFLPLSAREVGGQWHVESKADSGTGRPAFALIFNRSNARVTSITFST